MLTVNMIIVRNGFAFPLCSFLIKMKANMIEMGNLRMAKGSYYPYMQELCQFGKTGKSLNLQN